MQGSLAHKISYKNKYKYKYQNKEALSCTKYKFLRIRYHTMLDVPVSCIYNTEIPESLIYTQYRKLQYSSSNNTGNTSIVNHTILEAPVFVIQQY